MSKYMQWYYRGLISDAGSIVRMSIFSRQSLKDWNSEDDERLDALDMLMDVVWLNNGGYIPK